MNGYVLIKKLIPALLILALFVLPVHAMQIPENSGLNEITPVIQEESEEPEVIPVNITVPLTVTMVPDTEGEPLPGEDTFPVTVTPLTEGAPGPRSTVIVCKNTATVDLIFGSYSEPGEYSYQVTLGKSALTHWIENDAEVSYTLTVSVTEAEEGSLVAVASLEEMTAVKTYLSPLTVDVEVKWPDGGDRPVTVYLYETREGTKVEIGKVTIAKTNSWKASFTKDATTGVLLHPKGSYTVEEMDLYKFSERYDYNKQDPQHWVVTITNKEALPQTGQLNKPIPFLFLMGALCLVSGAWLMRKQRTYE